MAAQDMPGVRLMCKACGQIYRINIEVLTDCNPLRFCPTCGSPHLYKIGRITEAVEKPAGPLGIMPYQLRQLLYSTWKEGFAGAESHPTHPKFVDYLMAAVRKGDIPDVS